MAIVTITPTSSDAATAALLHARTARIAAEEATESRDDAARIAEDTVNNYIYGILSSDPATRPDGSLIKDGDQYYNSTMKALRMRIDGAWQTVAMTVAASTLIAANNLADVSSVPSARANLGLGSAATRTAGVAGGVAELDNNGKLPGINHNVAAGGGLLTSANLADLANSATARLNLQLGSAATKVAGAANGVADLDSGGKVPVAQLPTNVSNGIAGLDANGRVPGAQLNAGGANGVAQLDAGGVVPLSQLPASASNPTTLSKSADYTTVSGDQGKVVAVTTGSSTDVNITLVGANTAGDGSTMIIQKVDTGTKRVIVKDSDTVTQIAWLSNQWDAVCFRSTGSAWSLFWHKISPRVEVFNANSTWTKPPFARLVFAECIGSGGGGGGGSRGAAAVSAFGGTGGGGGARMTEWFVAADLASSESVVVPAGGAAGNATSTASPGGPGGDGGATTFGTIPKVYAGGGKGGAGGQRGSPPTPVQSAAGGSWWDMAAAATFAFQGGPPAAIDGADGQSSLHGGASGGMSSISGAAGAGGSSLQGCGAGGAGGGFGFSGTVAQPAAAGGKRGSGAVGGGGAAGTSGSSPTAGSPGSGLGIGGGGGGSSALAGGAAGGAGGIGAGGGGGGGVNTAGFSGAGGAGGAGRATITTVF
jgi:hypothetical protein